MLRFVGCFVFALKVFTVMCLLGFFSPGVVDIVFVSLMLLIGFCSGVVDLLVWLVLSSC